MAKRWRARGRPPAPIACWACGAPDCHDEQHHGCCPSLPQPTWGYLLALAREVENGWAADEAIAEGPPLVNRRAKAGGAG